MRKSGNNKRKNSFYIITYGYLKAEEITFTIEDTGEIQKVEMKDDVPAGTIIINKSGEFLDKVTALDSVGGWISHLFQYVTGSLKDVTFEVFALEDVKSADGLLQKGCTGSNHYNG